MTSVAEPLSGYSAATVYEAAGLDCALDRRIMPLLDTWRICARVRTVLTTPGQNLWLHRAVYRAELGDVLVVSAGGGVDFGYWGEILSSAAAARGIAGLVINACVRDVGELRRMSVPVFSRGHCVRGTGKDARDGGVGIPIEISGVSIHDGDVVVGDQDGVVIVPRAQVHEVALAAAQRVAKEEQILERLGKGATTLELYGWS